MSTATGPEPDDAGRAGAPAGAAPQAPPAARPRLVFDDPLDQRAADDTDDGWGERPSAASGSAADLARFLDEKPPHHI
ncbi:hypothetical protein [Streptomyces tremellae]|uniref:Uncharacterized protein n=1 Tax=Streptomyces tremellae TaxID=1124239 RepID=A0ABP7ELG7_9ACTN